DNTQILWPTDGGQLCYSALDSYVTIDGVMIHPVKNKKLLGLFENKNDASHGNYANNSLIVLNYSDTINISALLENYGLNYFKDRYWIEYNKKCLWMFPLTAATVWFIFSGPFLWWSTALLIF
ncbi:hypothetical protein, partial [Chryseobacterium sp. SIMBA_028]|uniref:hypothetical protein n=1 Tax=Chryseobacterium sp. SIMBA_028 TaxID=3085771 RepID=UPI00397B1519